MGLPPGMGPVQPKGWRRLREVQEEPGWCPRCTGGMQGIPGGSRNPYGDAPLCIRGIQETPEEMQPCEHGGYREPPGDVDLCALTIQGARGEMHPVYMGYTGDPRGDGAL